MAKGYWIGNIRVDDPDIYKQYTDRVRPYLAGLGARFLVRGGEAVCKEGTSFPRQIVIEFDSYAAALAAYDSPEYAEMIAIRQNGAEGTIVVVEGFE